VSGETVWVVVPTYNEADNLPVLVEALLSQPALPALRLLAVDDASPDGTGALAEWLAARYPGRMAVLHRPEKLGLGSAYVAGFRYALARGASHVGQMDADLSHAPADVGRLYQALDHADVAVGSRYVPGGEIDARWSPWRRGLSWWANRVWVRLALGLPVHDATSGFRLWRREVLEAIGLDRIRSGGYAFQIETTCLAVWHGFRVVEVPIRFEERLEGTSKLDTAVKVEAMWRVLALRRARGRRAGRAAAGPAPGCAAGLPPRLAAGSRRRQRT
jgi:dolichol-phosphate mannosyltransferase